MSAPAPPRPRTSADALMLVWLAFVTPASTRRRARTAPVDCEARSTRLRDSSDGNAFCYCTTFVTAEGDAVKAAATCCELRMTWYSCASITQHKKFK